DYDAERGARVIAWATKFLDDTVPLDGASWSDVTGLAVEDGRLVCATPTGETTLAVAEHFAGHDHRVGDLMVFLRNNGLLIEVRVDRSSAIGKTDPAGIADVWLESALTTIMDCEDSVAAVDAQDKTLVYGNWLGLMKGDLEETVTKAGKTFTRKLKPDVSFIGPDGETVSVNGRSLMLVRNVGHL
ncbi:MAG: malate synthase G, partial [Roseicyclus sp.]|nr:malate synthase G [Roseicyclus sp.]